MSELQDVVARLKAKRSGNGWVAKCPAHDDTRASLSIAEGKDGRLLLRCHAGCAWQDVRAALGLGAPGARREPLAVYPYHDETGRTLYEVHRFEPKDFRIRQPHGEWGLGRAHRVPYRLPSLLAACKAGKLVCVTEGEKDAEALRAAGVMATTILGGASAPLPDGFAGFFTGANRVVVLPDNDDPGRAYAARVAQALHAARIPVRVVALPGLEPKGDVSDWLGAGGTKEALRQLVKEAPDWSPATTEGVAPHSGEARTKPDDSGRVMDQGRVEVPRDGEPDHSARPVLDPLALHGLLGEYVRLVEPFTEAHPAGILFTLLACVGCWIGRGPYQTLDGSRHYLNLFVLLVGSTGAGRKGTAWAQALGLLRAADDTFTTERVRSGLSTGEGLIDFLLPNPATTDTGASAPLADTRVVMAESEFGAVLARKGREGNTLSAVLRQAWDGQPLANLTARKSGQPDRLVREPHVSLVGHITGSELRELVSRQDVRNGFLNRFAIVHVERVRLLPDAGPLPREKLATLAERLNRCASQARQRAEVALSPAARELWLTMYPDLSLSPEGDMGARAAAMVRRVALLFALLDGSREIESAHLMAARACWTYCEDSARFVLGSAGGLPELARRFLTAIRDAGSEGISRSGVWEAGGSKNRPESEVRGALQTLLDAGLIDARTSVGPNGGRPATRYFDARLTLGSVGNMGKMGNNPGLSSHLSHISHVTQDGGGLPVDVVHDLDQDGNVRQSLHPERVTELLAERRRRREDEGGRAA